MRKATFVAFLLVLSVVAHPAGASSGSRADADDVSTPLDIRTVYHGDTGGGSTQQVLEYYVESYSNFSDDQLLCGWNLDFNNDRTRDASFQVGGAFGGSVIVYNAGGQDSGTGSLSRTAAPSSSTSTAANTVKVVVPRSALGSAGFPAADTDYDYFVECGFSGQQVDVTPDDASFPGIHHTLGAASTDECPGHQSDARPDVIGTPGNDRITGITNAIVCGLGGNDIVRAAPDGATLLEGGDGSDVLCARQGAAGDQLDGGTGIDRARYENTETATNVERLASISLCA